MGRFALVAAIVLLQAVSSHGDTSLRVRGDWGAEEIDLPVRDVLITSRYGDPEGTLQVGVDCLPTACTIQHWAFVFRSALGQPLVDGVYEDTRPLSDEHPMLTFGQTGGGGGVCSPTGGRFEIRGLVPGGPNGSLLSATIDFEAPCGDRLLHGTLHIASGDGDCVGAADGAACDDQDPCTASEACTGRTLRRRATLRMRRLHV